MPSVPSSARRPALRSSERPLLDRHRRVSHYHKRIAIEASAHDSSSHGVVTIFPFSARRIEAVLMTSPARHRIVWSFRHAMATLPSLDGGLGGGSPPPAAARKIGHAAGAGLPLLFRGISTLDTHMRVGRDRPPPARGACDWKAPMRLYRMYREATLRTGSQSGRSRDARRGQHAHGVGRDIGAEYLPCSSARSGPSAGWDPGAWLWRRSPRASATRPTCPAMPVSMQAARRPARLSW